jgi:hypothetical protein
MPSTIARYCTLERRQAVGLCSPTFSSCNYARKFEAKVWRAGRRKKRVKPQTPFTEEPVEGFRVARPRHASQFSIVFGVFAIRLSRRSFPRTVWFLGDLTFLGNSRKLEHSPGIDIPSAWRANVPLPCAFFVFSSGRLIWAAFLFVASHAGMRCNLVNLVRIDPAASIHGRAH